MRVRNHKQTWTGHLLHIDPFGLGEIIVGYNDEPDGTWKGVGNEYIRDCEIQLLNGTWKDLIQSIKDGDIIEDDLGHNYHFKSSPMVSP